MSSKIIEYDLCSPGRNYDELYELIKSCPKWAKLTESTWFVKTDLTCMELVNKLSVKLDKNDRIFVCEMGRYAAWDNVICSDNYLLNNM